MNTGQVLLVIIAFVFLSTVLLNFNRTESMTSDSIYYAQDGILLTTVAQSYDQIARGLPFGAVDDTTYITPDQIWRLTPPADLGPDNSGEHTLAGLNDFDKFNGPDIRERDRGER